MCESDGMYFLIEFNLVGSGQTNDCSDDQPPVVNFKEKRSITDLSANISTLHAQKKSFDLYDKKLFLS